jgi:hypothetical protein
MKQVLTNKDQFVGMTMNKIVRLDEFYEDYKLYMFDDAVLIEKYSSYHYAYEVMDEYEVMNEAVNVNVNLDKIVFEYKNENSSGIKPHTIYNINSKKIDITPFGEALISNGIVTEDELMSFGNKKIDKEIERTKIERQRDIDECIAILAKYSICVNKD